MAIRLGVMGPFSGNPGRWICKDIPFFKMAFKSMFCANLLTYRFRHLNRWDIRRSISIDKHLSRLFFYLEVDLINLIVTY